MEKGQGKKKFPKTLVVLNEFLQSYETIWEMFYYYGLNL